MKATNNNVKSGRKKENEDDKDAAYEAKYKEEEALAKKDRIKGLRKNPLPVIFYLFIASAVTFALGSKDLFLGVGFMILALMYLKSSVVEVSNEENALKKQFKTLVDGVVLTDGLFLVWKFIEDLKRFPTEIMKINLKEQEVTTADDKKRDIFQATVKVDAAVSYKLPATFKGMKRLLIEAPDPEGLEELFAPVIMAAIRSTLGNHPWDTLRSNLPTLSEEVYRILKDGDGPVRRSCVEHFNITIEKVILPKPLEEALLERQAAIFEAEKRQTLSRVAQIEIENIGEANANSRRLMIKEMGVDPEAAEKVMYEMMANGPATTILGISPSFSKDMEGILHGRKRTKSPDAVDSDDIPESLDAVDSDDIPEEVLSMLKNLPEQVLASKLKKLDPKTVKKITEYLNKK